MKKLKQNNMKNIESIIINIAEETFKIISNIWNKSNSFREKSRQSRIIFPKKRGVTDIRVSEQELKQIFIEQFNLVCKNRDLDYLYSVETPTENKYLFKGDGAPKVINNNEAEGQSALIDMSIHDNCGKRVALIEFKALNPNPDNYHKDFVKLGCEQGEDVCRFFIHLITECDSGTIKNINGKYNFTYELSTHKFSIITMILANHKNVNFKPLESNERVVMLCK